MDSPVGAVLARYPRLGSSHSRNVFLLILEVRDQGAGGVVSPEASLLGLLLWPTWSLLAVHILCVSFILRTPIVLIRVTPNPDGLI